MRFQVSAIDHDGFAVQPGLRQFLDDAGKHAEAGPPDEAIVERLVRTILSRCIPPAKAVADHMDYTTESLSGKPAARVS